MDQNAWVMLFVGIAVSCGLLALGVVLYPKLKREEQGYPMEAAIEAALLPLIYEGICAAYRMSERGVDQLQQRIRGADKKAIADSIYRMLPDKVGDYDLSLIKFVVSQERFEQLVQGAFDRFDRFFIEHEAHFEELFEKWKAGNLPA
ncbi:MAG: hypothetical protein JSV81_22080 [Anaerolineales bacterium]|nr:MAG: hypothetical protein JSV81_22080 [Anaerolineales bacterium]